MKIIEKRLSEALEKERDYQQEYAIVVDGVRKIHVSDGGEPEDNTLGRDLSFVYSIVPLMKMAYDAGAEGEGFEVTSKKVDDLDEFYS